jgi:hypothetical protein
MSGDVNPNSGLTGSFLISGSNSNGSIYFPTIDEMSYPNPSIDNKILTWKGPTAYGKLVWDELRLPTTDYIGTTGSELNIYGNW